MSDMTTPVVLVHNQSTPFVEYYQAKLRNTEIKLKYSIVHKGHDEQEVLNIIDDLQEFITAKNIYAEHTQYIIENWETIETNYKTIKELLSLSRVENLGLKEGNMIHATHAIKGGPSPPSEFTVLTNGENRGRVIEIIKDIHESNMSVVVLLGFLKINETRELINKIGQLTAKGPLTFINSNERIVGNERHAELVKIANKRKTIIEYEKTRLAEKEKYITALTHRASDILGRIGDPEKEVKNYERVRQAINRIIAIEQGRGGSRPSNGEVIRTLKKFIGTYPQHNVSLRPATIYRVNGSTNRN